MRAGFANVGVCDLFADSISYSLDLDSAEGAMVLQLANQASQSELLDLGLSLETVYHIVDHRRGYDGVEGTEDDRGFETWAELDGVPFFDREAFDILLQHAGTVIVPEEPAPSWSAGWSMQPGVEYGADFMGMPIRATETMPWSCRFRPHDRWIRCKDNNNPLMPSGVETVVQTDGRFEYYGNGYLSGQVLPEGQIRIDRIGIFYPGGVEIERLVSMTSFNVRICPPPHADGYSPC